ncbi:MAG: hypothetical protein NT113_01785 [Hyphomicrobiales bacterium]|nr:hypothetical protein [Hyphomicrobiales bacterium]
MIGRAHDVDVRPHVPLSHSAPAAPGAGGGLCGLDVTNASVETIMSIADKGVGHSDMGTVADNHCHGCFSMTAEPLAFTAKPFAPEIRTVVFHDTERRGLPRAIDPRPPKLLT